MLLKIALEAKEQWLTLPHYNSRFFFVSNQETLDALAEMYSLLNEEDMWAGLWQQRCRYPETATAIAYETQGFYEQAQSAYEVVRAISCTWNIVIA